MRNLKDFTKTAVTGSKGEVLDYVEINALLDQEIIVTRADAYTSEKGPGVTIVFRYEEEGPEFYTATHAIGLVKTLAKPEVLEILAEEPMAAKIVRADSTTTKGRTVYRFA